MSVKKGARIDLLVEDIAFGGRGLARHEGLVVFVDQAVPGDRVQARILKKKKNYAEARCEHLLEASPDRVAAPCPYSGYCGGCKWQFLEYGRQLAYKRRHVAEALEHIGQVESVPVYETVPSEPIFGYRNKMEFSCADRRWLMPDELQRDDIDRSFALGLHVPGTFHKVLDTRACLLQPDEGNRILDEVRTFIRNSSEPVYGLRSHTGFWRFVVLRHSVDRNHWMVNLVTSREEREAVQPLADRLTDRFPAIASVMNNITARKAGIAQGEYEICLFGDEIITDRIGSNRFAISANSFFQTNTRSAALLYDIVQRYARLTGHETVFDLYCGTGTIAVRLSDQAREVVGFEIVPSAVADAETNCRINGIGNCRFVLGDIAQSLERIVTPPDVVIIDPPRAGMHKKVVRHLLAMAPERMVYVSCNPATLARDLGMLKENYGILEVQPVDMFPHTFHIEAVARLERK